LNYYIDIKVKPDGILSQNVLLNKLYSEFHKALYDLGTTSIGVSFPNYKIQLGNILRIHATLEDLEELQKKNWVEPLLKYCQISPISPIPKKVSYRIISRKQANMTLAKLRRLIKRGTITAEQATSYKAKMFTQGISNPYLELESSSNGQKHRRFIEFGDFSDTPIDGSFNQFGLSKTATIPWF
jgi:CRISPR-associated endonuclease Csy4